MSISTQVLMFWAWGVCQGHGSLGNFTSVDSCKCLDSLRDEISEVAGQRRGKVLRGEDRGVHRAVYHCHVPPPVC